MASPPSLQGLPPLPKSLHGLLTAGGTHWREAERIHNVKSSIQQDIPKTNTIKRPNLVVENGLICLVEDSEAAEGDSASGSSLQRSDTSKPTGKGPHKDSLESAIAFLRHEMVAVRQMDTSLLCQLWSVHEAVQELKQGLHQMDRLSETNSTCSSRSLDQGLDGIVEEESDYENCTFQAAPRLYENMDIVTGSHRSAAQGGRGAGKEGQKGAAAAEEEGDYLEPLSWQRESSAPKAISPGKGMKQPPPHWNLPPQLSLELLSLPPPPPLPLSSPPHTPPISTSPGWSTTSSDSFSSSQQLKGGRRGSGRRSSDKERSPGDRSPRDNKWPGYLLLNTSTTYESTC